MLDTKTKQHHLALILLSVTAFVWGAGFLLSDLLLQNGFAKIPLTLNALRFGSAALILIAVFCTKVKLNKQLLLYGGIGGAMLFGGFGLQLVGLNFTTPAVCGFFTASYTLFVPFLVWIARKKRPSLLVMLGVLFALIGMLAMNVPDEMRPFDAKEFLGNMLTLGGSLFFALQIVLADYVLNDKKIDPIGMTVTQVVTCGILFVITALIFECKNYSSVTVNWSNSWWSVAIVALLGTSFAYFAQTFAQNHLKPAEISVIIGCESPIGAVLSVAFGYENFSWQLLVGGIFVVLAVVFVEVLPNVRERKSKKETAASSDEATEKSADNPSDTQSEK